MAYTAVKFGLEKVGNPVGTATGRANIAYDELTADAKPAGMTVELCFGATLWTLLKTRNYFPVQLRNNIMQTYFAWKEKQFAPGDQTAAGVALLCGSAAGGLQYDGSFFIDSRGYTLDQDLNTNINVYGAAIAIGAAALVAASGESMEQQSVIIKEAIVNLLDWLKLNVPHLT